MVSSRRTVLRHDLAASKAVTAAYDAAKRRPRDVEEDGRRSPRFRFRDVVNATIDLQKNQELKKKLLESIDQNELQKYRKSEEEIKAIPNKKVQEYYKRQNEILDDWLEVDTLVMAVADDVLDSMHPIDMDGDGFAEHGGGPLRDTEERLEPFLPDEEREKRRKAERKARFAVNINVMANVFLLLAKIVAVFFSDSLSLIASTVDSALDLLCTLIIWSTSRVVQWKLNKLKAKFPVGRRRLEPLGILVFSVIMVLSFFQVLQESIEKLASGGKQNAVELPPLAIASMAGTIGIKGIIWFGCIRIRTTQVQALAQDCKTDVYFNTLSLLFPVLGHRLNIWWLDPLGATLLSLFIIVDWAGTCLENVTRLTGVAASDRLTRKMTFLAWRFHPLVDAYKSLKAYHAGDGIWVEIDVLFDEHTELRRAHDVAETLQYCCEGLSEVDRAFVTMDYTSQGPTGHATENL